MKKIKIGLPRALHYHKYGVFWKSFFEGIGCKVILSPTTNKEILKLGNEIVTNNCCISYKIYLGHIIYLKDKCDYILLSRICNYGKNNKVCLKYDEIYDNIKESFSSKEIIEYNIEHTSYNYHIINMLKIGLKLNKNLIRVIVSYIIAIKKQKRYNQIYQNEQKNNLNKPNKKILIIAKYYNISDKLISNYIIDYLKNKNIIAIFSNQLDEKTSLKFSEYYPDILPWILSKEEMGSLYYYKHMIDGIIFISSKNCTLDNIVNTKAIKNNKEIPSLNIIIDDTNTNLPTSLEAFCNQIFQRK